MKLVSQNSEDDLAARRAAEAKRTAEEVVEYAIRELAANLILIIRGGGKPHETGRQAHQLVEAYLAFKETVGHWPTAVMLTECLRFDSLKAYSHLSAIDNHVEIAKEEIINGALLIAASRLLAQSTETISGDNQLYIGVDKFEKARNERQKQRWAKSGAQRAPRPKAKKAKDTSMEF